jgi:Ni/Fe-hydrogenase 1 B-type cytochrome subunit
MTATTRRAANEVELVTVRVWELPVRVIHWTVFGCVVVLSLTGFYIGNPFLSTGSETGFLMGTVLAAHRATAWIFCVAVISRIIWAFRGNHFSRWHQFIPVHKERRGLAKHTISYYIFQRHDPPPVTGHNPLAGMTYLVVYVMFLAQIFTGLALQSVENPGGWQDTLGGWVFNFWSIPGVRLFHHLVMWLTLGFVIHHIYAAMLIDYEEKSGLMSSIFNSYKRVPKSQA